MSLYEANKEIKEIFISEFISNEIRIKYDIPTGFQNRKILYDMDKLWFNKGGNALTNLKGALVSIYKDFFSSMHIDTILVGVSPIFSFGAVPFASFIAEEFKKTLIIAIEGQYERYIAFPSSFGDRKAIFKGRKILLIKDVIIQGFAIEKLKNIIDTEGGSLDGVIVFLDLGKENRIHINKIQASSKWVNILFEKDINGENG